MAEQEPEVVQAVETSSKAGELSEAYWSLVWWEFQEGQAGGRRGSS